LNNATRDC